MKTNLKELRDDLLSALTFLGDVDASPFSEDELSDIMSKLYTHCDNLSRDINYNETLSWSEYSAYMNANPVKHELANQDD